MNQASRARIAKATTTMMAIGPGFLYHGTSSSGIGSASPGASPGGTGGTPSPAPGSVAGIWVVGSIGADASVGSVGGTASEGGGEPAGGVG